MAYEYVRVAIKDWHYKKYTQKKRPQMLIFKVKWLILFVFRLNSLCMSSLLCSFALKCYSRKIYSHKIL